MTLQRIAKDLYRLQREVDRLEKELADSPLAGKDVLKRKLAQAKTERDQMRQILNGHLDR